MILRMTKGPIPGRFAGFVQSSPRRNQSSGVLFNWPRVRPRGAVITSILEMLMETA